MVCGATGTLGRAVVAELSRQGHPVAALGRSGADVAGASFHLGVDLTQPEAVEEAFVHLEALGELGALVNVAGGFSPGSVAGGPEGALRDMLAVNLETAWWSCRAAAPRLARRGGGAIVNVASRSALQAAPGAAAYTVSKTAVVRLTELLAAELAPSRVRVNAVLPGVIATPANRGSMSAQRLAAAVPPEAIAAVIAFLLSDAAWPISGALVPTYGWS